MKDVYLEAGKEFMRVVVLAVIPVLIDSLNRGEIDYRIVWITGAIAGLRFLDKLLHLAGKEAGNDTVSAGLTRF